MFALFKALLLCLFFAVCFSGCGGSSNSTDTVAAPAAVLTLNADSFTIESARANLLDVLANDGQNLQLLSVTGGQGISVNIENNQLRYVARCCDQLSDTLQYTASNTAGRTATANVQLTILPTLQQELSAPGLGASLFQIEGGASPIGAVQSSAIVRSPFNATETVQIAYASNDRGLEWVSVLGTMAEQNQRSGNSGTLSAANWDAMRLSPLSTALAGSLIRLNAGQLPATGTQLQELLRRVDWQQVLERADLIHAVTSSAQPNLAANKKLIDIALDDAIEQALRPRFNMQALLAARAQWLGALPSLPSEKLRLYRGGNLLAPLALEFSGSMANGFSVLGTEGRFAGAASASVLTLAPGAFGSTLMFDRIKEAGCLPLNTAATFKWVRKLAVSQIEITPILLSKLPSGTVTAFDTALQGLDTVDFFAIGCTPLLEQTTRKQVLRNAGALSVVSPGTALTGDWLIPYRLNENIEYFIANFTGGNMGLNVSEGNQIGPRSVLIDQVAGNYLLRYSEGAALSIQLLEQDGESFSGLIKLSSEPTQGNKARLVEVWLAKKQTSSFKDVRFANQRLSECCTAVGVSDIDFDASGRPTFAQEVLPNESVLLTDGGQLVVNTRLDDSFRNVEFLTPIALLQGQRVLVMARSARNNFDGVATVAAAKLVPVR